MNISVIGTGIIGRKIVELLLKEKYSVCVFNRSPEAIEELCQKGAMACESVSEAIDSSESIILTLPDTTAIKGLIFDKDVNLKNKTLFQMGTIAPAESEYIERKVEECNGRYLESPILGSRKEIEQQSLILMVGGSKNLFEQYIDFLNIFGDKVYYVGSVGQAAALKLSLNHIIASHVIGFSLSLGIIEKSNIDTQLFSNILKSSSLYAPMYDKKLNNWKTGQYSDPNFSTKHLLKDINLICSHSSEMGLNTDVVSAMSKMYQKSIQDGLGDLDYSSVYKTINREEL